MPDEGKKQLPESERYQSNSPNDRQEKMMTKKAKKYDNIENDFD